MPVPEELIKIQRKGISIQEFWISCTCRRRPHCTQKINWKRKRKSPKYHLPFFSRDLYSVQSAQGTAKDFLQTETALQDTYVALLLNERWSFASKAASWLLLTAGQGQHHSTHWRALTSAHAGFISGSHGPQFL